MYEIKFLDENIEQIRATEYITGEKVINFYYHGILILSINTDAFIYIKKMEEEKE